MIATNYNPERVEVTLDSYGRQRKQGISTLQVGPTEASILSRLGWRTIHRGRTYHYMAPADGELAPGERPAVTLDVPGQDFWDKLSSEMHESGKDAHARVGDINVRYSAATEYVPAIFSASLYGIWGRLCYFEPDGPKWHNALQIRTGGTVIGHLN